MIGRGCGAAIDSPHEYFFTFLAILRVRALPVAIIADNT